MWFVGDVHGKTEEFKNVLKRRVLPNCEDDEPVIQVGDMAIGFPGVHLQFVLDPRVKFFRGNHDNPVMSRLHPLYIRKNEWDTEGSDFGYDEKHKTFWLAGAWSIDANMRLRWEKEGGPRTWWPDEQLSDEQLEAALRLYIEKKPEIVATHEAPSSVVPEVLWMPTELIAPGVYADAVIKPGDPTHSPEIAEMRVKTGYYQRKEKLGCVETRTSQALQRMLNHHAPKHWIFGHYHISKQFELGGTLFRCVAELEPYRIEPIDPRNQADGVI